MSLPQKNVRTEWDAGMAYIIGIFASDGNVSSDLRHLNITTKDEELALLSKKILGITNKIGRKTRGGSEEKKYYTLQFGDVNFVKFLNHIGITPNKSKTIRKVAVPKKYFKDFLRGLVDGDGCIDTFMHPESKSPQARLRIASASPEFIRWLQVQIKAQCGTNGGWIYAQKTSSVEMLTYAKRDSVKILKYMYYAGAIGLTRKRVIAMRILGEW